MTVNAHFDGTVIVPDEPLDLRPNQPLRIQIEPLEDEAETSALAWIAANAVESDALPTDLAEQHDHYLYGRPKGHPRVVATYFADTSFWIGSGCCLLNTCRFVPSHARKQRGTKSG